MTINGILETSLYSDNLGAAVAFYRRVFGFEVMFEDERLCAMSVAGRNVLLLFKRGASTAPASVPGGTIAPHDGAGPIHIAFAVSAADLGTWEKKLAAEGIPIESTVNWTAGGRSIYFRDPDNHLLELATPGIWPIY